MKLRTIVKIAVISSVVLLCTGFAMFSFFRLSAVEGRKDFNLYTLVPGSATVVLETDDLAGMIQGINELSCSKDRHFLYVSKLFSYLKLHLYTLLEDTPHGLSKQMNKVLLSFHEPDNDRNQVLITSWWKSLYVNTVRVVSRQSCLTIKGKRFVFIRCRMTVSWLVISLPTFWL